MARYEYACYPCDWAWEIQHDMVTIVDHRETCPDCGETATRLYSIGMIKVTNGTAPTRMGKTYQRTPKSRDRGFQKEFNSIFSDAGMQDPNTGEDYKIQDDEGSDGQYLAPDSQRKEHKEALETARARGTMPSASEAGDNLAKFHENSLRRARERLRKWPVGRKGRKT